MAACDIISASCQEIMDGTSFLRFCCRALMEKITHRHLVGRKGVRPHVLLAAAKLFEEAAQNSFPSSSKDTTTSNNKLALFGDNQSCSNHVPLSSISRKHSSYLPKFHRSLLQHGDDNYVEDHTPTLSTWAMSSLLVCLNSLVMYVSFNFQVVT